MTHRISLAGKMAAILGSTRLHLRSPKSGDQPVAQDIDTSLNYRAMPVSGPGAPLSMDESTRSVEMVGATETAVNEIDWDRWEKIPTVLRMDGCQMPTNKQLPLLDTHRRSDTSCVIGSFRDIRIEGSQLIGRAFFSAAPEAEGPYLKTKEGHLTDCSIARLDLESTYIPEGQRQAVGGTMYDGPIKVVTSWTPKEMSMCPIGADEMAKVRAATTPVIPRNPKKENEMDPKLRAFLVSRGLSETATEEEARRFLETLQVRDEAAPPAGTVDAAAVTEQVRSAFLAEQSRCTDIRAICSRAGLPETKITEFITGGTSVEAVRSAAFEHVVTSGPAPVFRSSTEVGTDARDKFRQAAEGSLIIRCGHTCDDSLIKLGARDLAGFTLVELARESLRMAGQSALGGNVLEMVGRSFTTSDFPLLLSNVANKELLDGWETQEETWPSWVAEGSVSDFKTHTAVRPGEVDSLDEIGEDDEYKYGTRTEQSESYKIATFGKLFKISRQTIINDDLGALSEIPREHGEAATRTVGDVVYAVLTANSAMGDGTALFHSNHKNLAASGAVVSVDSLGLAETAMGLQKDIGGKRRLNIKPAYFLCPLTKKAAAEQFFSTPVVGTQAQPNLQNIYSGAYFTRIYEPRLDDASTTAWYLAARKGKTVKVFFLNGNKTPFLDTKQGWSTDGVEFKVRIDVGAKAMGWKGLYKNPGS
jgi:hypothetical protein